MAECNISLFYALYSHTCVKTVFDTLQALRRYNIPWANKDLSDAFIYYSHIYCVIFKCFYSLMVDSANRG